MKTATGVTVNRQRPADRRHGPRRRSGRGRRPRDGRIAYAGPVAGAAAGPSDARRLRRPRRHDPAGAGRRRITPTYFDVAALEDLDVNCTPWSTHGVASVNAGWRWSAAIRRPQRRQPVNIDFWAEKAIENELILGPRLAASGRRSAASAAYGLEPRTSARSAWRGWCSGHAPPRRGRPAQAGQGRRRVGQTYPTGDAASPTPTHHTLSMTFEENARLRSRRPHNHHLKGDRPLPATLASRTPSGPATTRWSTPRSSTTRAWIAVGARRAGWCRALQFEYARSSTASNSACRGASIDGPRRR